MLQPADTKRAAMPGWHTGWRRASRTAARMLSVFGFIVLYFALVPEPLTSWVNFLAVDWDQPDGDTLIVLGGDVTGDGTLGMSSYLRSVGAAQAWQSGHFRKIVICGGNSSGQRISPAMKDFLIYKGVPASDIVTEDDSRSTRDNALNALRLIGSPTGRIVLMTSDYHMFRSLACFRRVGLNVVPRPVLDAAKQNHSRLALWQVCIVVIRESVKISYYKINGWI